MKPRNMKKMSKVNDHEVLRSEREEEEGRGRGSYICHYEE
jgi:hypothetical protein